MQVSLSFRQSVVLLSLLLVVLAPALNAAELPVPALRAHINDYADMISNDTQLSLEQTLVAHEKETSNQVVVLTIPSLQGDVLESFANRVFNTWKLGEADRDNGVLLLLTRAQGRIRIEVGNGLEGDLTDIQAGSIIRKQIKPAVVEERYEDGITLGAEAILATIAQSYQRRTEAAEDSGWISTLILCALGAALLYLSACFFLNRKMLTSVFTGYFAFVLLLAVLGVTIGLGLLGIYLMLLIVYWLLLRDTPEGQAFVGNWNWYSVISSGSGGGGSAHAIRDDRYRDDIRSSDSGSDDSYSGGGGESGGGGASDD